MTPPTSPAAGQPLIARWAIALELALFVAVFAAASAFVPASVNIGFITVPTRIFIYFGFAWLALRRRGLGWRAVGLQRPERWGRVVALGAGAAVALQITNSLILGPILTRLTGAAQNLSRFANLAGGNIGALLGWLVVTWTLAAFGEELIFRGYLMQRLADLLGETRAGWAVSLLASSVLFALAHVYQGAVGAVLAGVSGLVAGLLTLRQPRNLWPAIIMHGVLDTIGFVLLYALFQCCAGAVGQ